VPNLTQSLFTAILISNHKAIPGDGAQNQSEQSLPDDTLNTVVFDDDSMRRRQLLALTGGTVSIAVAGCLGDDDETEPVDTDDDDGENGTPENGEDDDGGDDENGAPEPELDGLDVDVSDSVLPVDDETSITVTASYDDGSEETVTDDATITSDDESLVSVSEGTITWEGEGTVTLTVEYEGFEETVEVETEADEEDEDAEPFELGDAFEAEGVGGYISFAEESEADAEEEGLTFPTEAEDGEAIAVEATVDGDTWESTSVEFPEVDTGTARATIEALDGLSGDIDFENGIMTAEGTLEVTIEDDDSFEFEISATSEESGELSGDVDAEFAPAEVTVVDNEFIIDDETGDALIDGFLGLPAEDPGENWLVLTFEMVSE